MDGTELDGRRIKVSVAQDRKREGGGGPRRGGGGGFGGGGPPLLRTRIPEFNSVPRPCSLRALFRSKLPVDL